MYIRYNTQSKKVIYIGEKKPLNADTELLKVAEYNGEIPKADWLTVGKVEQKTRIVQEKRIIQFADEENPTLLVEKEIPEVTETYLECAELIPHFIGTEQKVKKEKAIKIAELKRLLNQTDYQAIKYAEGWLSAEEYAPIKQQRQAYRDEINNLEKRG